MSLPAQPALLFALYSNLKFPLITVLGAF